MQQPCAAPHAIRAGWLIAFDGTGHRIIRNGVVAWSGDTIVHVGTEAPAGASVQEEPGKLVMPGLISTHAHVGLHAGDRLVVDQGRRDLQYTGFLNYMTRRAPDGPSLSSFEDPDAAAAFGFAALLRGGVTTVLDMGSGGFRHAGAMIDAARLAGIRLYYGPYLAVADYFHDKEQNIVRQFRPGTEAALLHAAEDHAASLIALADERIRPAIVVDELFTATPELLTGAKDIADRLGAPFTLHVAEQVFEFHETLRTTGRTPVGYLEQLGVLGKNVILGHCVYVSGHSATSYPYPGDLEIVAASGSHVSHAPVAWSRRGVILENFQRFLDHGIGMALGTDSYPQDMLAEMRLASTLCKVVTRNDEAASAGDVFTAATIGGANALGRADLGRLAPGAKADIVVLDFDHPRIGPIYDPIHALIHCATASLVDEVIIGGQTVVRSGSLLFGDEQAIIAEAGRSASNAWWNFDRVDLHARPVEAVFRKTFQAWEGS